MNFEESLASRRGRVEYISRSTRTSLKHRNICKLAKISVVEPEPET
jgi:hypothetical protein